MAQLRHLRQKFAAELVIIGVHSGKFLGEKSIENIRAAVMRLGIEHPVVNDPDFVVWQHYTVRAWPTLVLIDPQGKVVDTQSGEIMAEEYAHKIEALREIFTGSALDHSRLAGQPEWVGQPRLPLRFPAKLLLTPAQTLFIADTNNHLIRVADLAGQRLDTLRLTGL